jgi:hypothetical protein
MKRLIYSYILSVLLLLGCAEDFLDDKNLYEKSNANYYSTPEDFDEALAGVYSSMPSKTGGSDPFIWAKLMSDDAFGGGGADDIPGFHAMDGFKEVKSEHIEGLFGNYWPGILRANLIISKINDAEYSDENRKKQVKSEAHFMRAFFYFTLSKFFGPVPLKLKAVPENLPRATPEEMYGQIASDLKTAIENMPSTPFQDISSSRLGHANKWAAEALLARVFLFYTGYYNKTSIELTDGTSITKENVITYLVDCIDNSGHDLLDDYRRLWPYSDVSTYTYTQDVSWAGDGNIESVFAIKYSNISDWDGDERYSNQHSLYVGTRAQFAEPFGYGWGGGPVNPALWDSFEDDDLRKDASIVNINDPIPHDSTYANNYEWGKWTAQHETGFLEKKYMPAAEIRNGNWHTIFYWNYGAKNSSEQLTNMQDDILIRFADVLLMAAELGAPNAQNYFDRVRTRAGLASKTVSLDAIKLERRHEFAFEGLRYFDLLRWGLDEAETAIESANGTIVKNEEIDSEYNIDFRPETGGFLAIPQTEITLSEGVLEQTPGW